MTRYLFADCRFELADETAGRRLYEAGHVPGAVFFDLDPQQVFRPWIHYWMVPGVLRFSLSPIGYWVTWTPGEESSLYPNKVVLR